MTLRPDTVSLTTQVWRSVFARDRLGKFLPYDTFDDQTDVYYCNDNQFGTVIECAPRLGMNLTTAATMEEILELLPETMFMQVVLNGSKNEEDVIKNWENDHLQRVRDGDVKSEAIETAIHNMAEFFRDKHQEKITRNMTAKLKKFRLFIVLKSADLEELKKIKDVIFDLLDTNSFYPEFSSAHEMKRILYEIFNGNHFKEGNKNVYDIPEYEPERSLGAQIISPDTKIEFYDTHLIADDRYWKTLSPQRLSKFAHIGDFGHKLGDYLSAAMDTNQFQDSFFITINISHTVKSAAERIRSNHTVINGQEWGEKFKEFWKRKHESVVILDKFTNQEKLFDMDMNIVISGESKKELDSNAGKIISYWNKGGDNTSIKLTPSDGVHQLVFIASLPLGINSEYLEITDKAYRLFGNQITQFLPLEADYSGTHPNMMFFTRRSQMAGLDLFISDGSFNAYLIAGSGAGKSVLLNILAFLSYTRGNMVFIVDIGGSYKKQCEVLNGMYIEPDKENPQCVNPFTDIDSLKVLDRDLEYLSSFVYMLGASKSEARSDEVEKLIKTKLNDTIKDLYKGIGRDLEITHIKDNLIGDEDVRFRDFAIQLSPYSKGGIYEDFFCGKSEINLKAEFIVCEMQKVENEPGIRDPLIMILLYHIGNRIYGSKGKSAQMIIDEAHKFIGKNPRMDDFIEQAYRRFRKEGASMVIATQSFADIYDAASGKLSVAGRVIVDNSPWKFFMKQTQTSINSLINSGVFDFSSMEKRIIKSITTVKRQYSEIFVMTPHEQRATLRLVMDRYFYLMTTTDPADKAMIQKVVDQNNVSTEKAIEMIVSSEKESEQKSEVDTLLDVVRNEYGDDALAQINTILQESKRAI